jgi:serine/threonine-protein kinase
MTPPITLPLEGELFDGKYRIGSVLGIGGMAAVIAARHMGFDGMVALKILLPECCDDPDVVERFVQEGKTATRIRSEHVVRMLDVGVVDGRAYLVMEYLDGRDLEAHLKKDGPLTVSAAADLLLQACEAIGEAHALGIVHRDLKPANLFLTHRADGSACLKVLDFGISKMPRGVSGTPGSSAHPTLPSMVMGSPHYMSPEQMASAASADQRADIWSLGAILYELLTGHLAFEGSTTSEVCARVLQGTPVPLVQLRTDIPGDVGLIIARCLERDLSRRYANVAELARALAPFGTEGGRASADAVARIVEGGLEERSPSLEPDAPRQTAAAILATAPARRPRVSGYLVGALVALAAAGVLVGSRVRHTDAPPVEMPIALAQVTAAPPPLVPPPPASSFQTAGAVGAAAPRALAAKPRHGAAPLERSEDAGGDEVF